MENGYSRENAEAKVCQDLVLDAISKTSLSRNVTIKGGVVMRSKTKNIRRATQDMDIDFIKYSLSDESINRFIQTINCIDGVTIQTSSPIEQLKQQDYSGKSVYIKITDSFNNDLETKLDLGVHNRFEIEQEEYCFDISLEKDGVSLLINSNEQMFVEKLRSLLKFGTYSTRYKDVFDLYYLSSFVNKNDLMTAINSYIIHDTTMREDSIEKIICRLTNVSKDKRYTARLNNSNRKWIDVDGKEAFNKIIETIKSLTE